MLLAALLLAGLGALSAAPAAAAGRWQWPLAGTPRVLRGFEPPPSPYAAGHRGVDLAAPAGAPVLAAGAGIVGYAGMLGGRGVVTVVHGSLRTTYEPVTASVQPGQLVGRGMVIGHLQPGAHCGPTRPCLHWGLLRGTVYLDPLALLGLNAVRLLPVWTAAGGGRYVDGTPARGLGVGGSGAGPAAEREPPAPGAGPVPGPTEAAGGRATGGRTAAAPPSASTSAGAAPAAASQRSRDLVGRPNRSAGSGRPAGRDGSVPRDAAAVLAAAAGVLALSGRALRRAPRDRISPSNP